MKRVWDRSIEFKISCKWKYFCRDVNLFFDSYIDTFSLQPTNENLKSYYEHCTQLKLNFKNKKEKFIQINLIKFLTQYPMLKTKFLQLMTILELIYIWKELKTPKNC